MATDSEKDEKSIDPGFGMRLTVAGICKKFPTVKNVSTSQLYSWMKQTENQSKDQLAKEEAMSKQSGTGNLVILVCF